MLTILLWLGVPVYLFVYAIMCTITFRAFLQYHDNDRHPVPFFIAAMWPLGLPLIAGALAGRWLLDRPHMPRARIITRSNRND